MSINGLMQGLRDKLYKEPSTQLFRQVMSNIYYIGEAGDDDFYDMAISYAKAHMDNHWPDDLRSKEMVADGLDHPRYQKAMTLIKHMLFRGDDMPEPFLKHLPHVLQSVDVTEITLDGCRPSQYGGEFYSQTVQYCLSREVTAKLKRLCLRRIHTEAMALTNMTYGGGLASIEKLEITQAGLLHNILSGLRRGQDTPNLSHLIINAPRSVSIRENFNLLRHILCDKNRKPFKDVYISFARPDHQSDLNGFMASIPASRLPVKMSINGLVMDRPANEDKWTTS